MRIQAAHCFFVWQLCLHSIAMSALRAQVADTKMADEFTANEFQGGLFIGPLGHWSLPKVQPVSASLD